MRTFFVVTTCSLLSTLIFQNCYGQQPAQVEGSLAAPKTVVSTSKPQVDSLVELLFDPPSVSAQPTAQSDRQLIATSQPPAAASPLSLSVALDPLPNAPSLLNSTSTSKLPAPSTIAANRAPAPRTEATAVIIKPVPRGSEHRPDPLSHYLIVNSVMYGATVFDAFERHAEIQNCISEAGGLKNGLYAGGVYAGQKPGTLSKFYAITIPIDVGVSVLSALARRKGWRSFEYAGPAAAASAHITAGAFKMSAGCY